MSKLLRIFGDIRPGEAGTALLMLLNLFLLLVGYYVIKTVREPLILTMGEQGAELKSYAAAAQALVLMGFIPLYGWLASRVERNALIGWVIFFFIACVELFNLGLRVRMPYLGFIFYVWVGIFSLATIAQFWSFANDYYPRDVGERLFPLIGIGATAGSPVGAKIAQKLFDAHVTESNMLHVTSVLLFAHFALYRIVMDREKREDAAAATPPAAREALAGPGGFELVFRSRYLKLIAVLLILLNIVNTTGEYIIGKSVVAAANAAAAADPAIRAGEFIGSFYGEYFFWVSVAAVTLQALVASRLVQFFGLAGVLLALPLVSLGSYALIGVGVGFAILRWAKTAENATDYSIMNTARQMLWLPTSREEKYKAKQALDTFFVRTGDLVSAGIVYAGTHWLTLGVTGFARSNVLLVVVWLLVAGLVVRENRALVAAKDAEAAG